MDKVYMKGELLQVYTKNSEIFEGRFYSMDKSIITLCDVKGLPQGVQYEGVCHYHDSEVRNIVKLHKTVEHKHLQIPQNECEEIILISKKYKYINQVDESFHEAVEDLNRYKYIGLSTDGSMMGRKCKMPFLVVSTPQQIYIFDTQVMQHNPFDAGLKKILESDKPIKIIHDCKKISDCLFHKHDVKLKSVFDTQVGDLIISKNKMGCLPTTVKSLSECLNIYLGLQQNSIEEKLDLLQCTERPLSVEMKDTLAKNIAYLHLLSKIIRDEMMLPFVRGVECYLETLRSRDDLKAWEFCGKEDRLLNDLKSAIEY